MRAGALWAARPGSIRGRWEAAGGGECGQEPLWGRNREDTISRLRTVLGLLAPVPGVLRAGD